MFRFNREEFGYLPGMPFLIKSWRDFYIFCGRKGVEHYLTKSIYVPIPCGQCLECRIKRSREWANRCVFESLNYPVDQCHFLTLTIDTDHLMISYLSDVLDTETGEVFHVPEISLRPLQLFFKRLRYLTGQKFRYLACGEYGSKNHRPHYHVIFFGLDLGQFFIKGVPYKYYTPQFSMTGAQSESLSCHDIIDDAWQYQGHAVLGSFSWQSAAYVGRYTTKKMQSHERKESKERFVVPHEVKYKDLKERLIDNRRTIIMAGKEYSLDEFQEAFVTMSRKPGIGHSSYDDSLYDFDTLTVPQGYRTHNASFPRYFDKLHEVSSPLSSVDVKNHRRQIALASSVMELQSSDVLYLDTKNCLRNEALKRKLNALSRQL